MVIPSPLSPTPVESVVQALPSLERIEQERVSTEPWEDAVGITGDEFSNLNEPSTHAINNGKLPSESSQHRYDLRPRKNINYKV